MIYIISDGEHHKIGYTAGDPKDRLQMLQVGSSRALVLVTTLPGEMPDEKRLHTRFAHALGAPAPRGAALRRAGRRRRWGVSASPRSPRGRGCWPTIP